LATYQLSKPFKNKFTTKPMATIPSVTVGVTVHIKHTAEVAAAARVLSEFGENWKAQDLSRLSCIAKAASILSKHYIENTKTEIMENFIDSEEMEPDTNCRTCQGTGEFTNSIKCDECSGTGTRFRRKQAL